MPPPSAPAVALALFVAVFAVATLRGVHIGLLAFVAACAVGVALAGMPLREVVAGFPVGILILVAGVTFFFSIAQLNGMVDRLIGAMLSRTGGRPKAVPVLFFALAAVTAAMGSPQAGLATGPVGMSAARRAGVDPVLMAIAINGGISAGAFAPTSLFGVITYRVARQAGIGVSPFVLLAVAAVANVLLLLAALLIFRSPFPAADYGEPAARVPASAVASADAADGLRFHRTATVVCLVGFVLALVACAAAGVELDIGVALLGLGAVLALLHPAIGARAFARIDWSTAFVVCGIVTYVGVLQELDAVNLLGREAMAVGTPFVAATLICMIGALVSAFASTTGVLAALVPMAVPLAASGGVPGWALITTLGVSATVVDGSPFSNTGATLIASAHEEDRPRLRRLLLQWSMAMVVVGPAVLLSLLLVLPG